MNADREMFIFPVQLTTSRIGNLSRLIHTLAISVAIHIQQSGNQPDVVAGLGQPNRGT